MIQPYAPDARDWIQALEAGQQAGMTRRKNQAVSEAGGYMASGDYEGAARAMLPVDPSAGLQIRNVGLQTQDRETKLKRQTAVQEAIAAGDIAKAFAAAGPDADLLSGVEKVAEHAKRIQDTLLQTYGSLKPVPYEKRREVIASRAPDLMALGVPKEKIDGFDPTDDNIMSATLASMTAKEQLDYFAPRYEKLGANETLAAIYRDGAAPPEPGQDSIPAASPAASAPPAGAETADARLPRGLRNNNPLNLRPLAQGQWNGQTGVDDGNYARFGSEQDGWNAAHRNLETYGSKYGINTVAGVINRWAPAGDNNQPQAYAATVAKALGVAPDAQINLSDQATREKLLEAMAQVELGQPYRPGQAAPQAAASPSAAPPATPVAPQTSLGPNVRVAARGPAAPPVTPMNEEQLKQWRLDPGTVAFLEPQKDGTIAPHVLQRGRPSRQDPPSSAGLSSIGNGYYRDKLGRTFQPNATGVLTQVGSLTDQVVSKTVDTVSAISETQAAVQRFKSAIAALKPTEFGPLGRYAGDPAKFATAQAAATNLMMLVKGPAFYNLGVLSGPDQAILEGMIANPSKWGTLIRQRQTIPQVEQLETGLRLKHDITLKGFKAMGGDPEGLAEITGPSAAGGGPAAGDGGGKQVKLPNGGVATVRVKR